VRRVFIAVAIAAVSLATLPGHAAPQAYSRPFPFKVRPGRLLSFGARDSGNWAGYNLGYVSDGRKLFNQISGSWTVPTTSLHAAENEYSVNWVGIGGGCIDKNCLAVDPTLIQAGTGQYIDSSGARSYFAWWEIIPGPILQIANFPVRAGDTFFVDIRLAVAFSDLWKIKVVNNTTGQTYTVTVPYPSTRLTAEWIEERPSVGGLPAPMPQLTNPRFNNSMVNKAPTNLGAGSAINMVNGSQRLATPSNPDPDRNGFNVCTYTTSCAAPTGG
jgi:peptidase A4-like protein